MISSLTITVAETDPPKEATTMHPLTLYALELSRDREREINAERLLAEQRRALAEPDDGRRLSVVRHPVALVLAGLSRGSAAAVRRLDACVADDLGRSLAPSE